MSTHFYCENVCTKHSIELLLIFSGDAEQNFGLEKEKSHITFSQWNLSGLMAHNFIKVSLLQNLPVTNDYDIICLTETFLDSPFQYIIRCALIIRKRRREEVFVFITRTIFLL